MGIRRDEKMIVNGKWKQVGVSFRTDKSGHRQAVFQCGCGQVSVFFMQRQPVEGCQTCTQKAKQSVIKNKRTGTKEYAIWNAMRQRCANPNARVFRHYGGRGIAVCKRWQTFENFLADMGSKPDGMSLDRIDNSKGYEPSNCRWVTQSQQLRNTRRTHFVQYRGEVKCVSDWAKVFGCSASALSVRLAAGWSMERCESTPLRKRRKKCEM